MKIALFGASGATGTLLTTHCLVAGYDVTALVRRPEAFAHAGRVRVVEGTAFDAEAVRRTVEGADAVLSTLGARSLKKEDVLERCRSADRQRNAADGCAADRALGSAGGAKDDSLEEAAGVAAMVCAGEKDGVQHISEVCGGGVAGGAVEGAGGGELDWTIVMPPMLTNGAGSGTYRVDGEALPQGAWRLSGGSGGFHDGADWERGVGGTGRVYGVEWESGNRQREGESTGRECAAQAGRSI